MADGTRDHKKLEATIKEVDQKREKDSVRIEGKLDAAVDEIKSMIHGMTVQYNDLRNQWAQSVDGRAGRR